MLELLLDLGCCLVPKIPFPVCVPIFSVKGGTFGHLLWEYSPEKSLEWGVFKPIITNSLDIENSGYFNFCQILHDGGGGGQVMGNIHMYSFPPPPTI